MRDPSPHPPDLARPDQSVDASRQIDARIAALAGWRGEMLAEVRGLILGSGPAIIEAWKWRGVPVWTRNGIICTGESYRSVIKLTFPNGASLQDPQRLFNASLQGNVRRAIDLHEGSKLDRSAFQALIRAAVQRNLAKG